MSSRVIFEILIHFLPISFHAYGMYLLYRYRNLYPNKSQYLYLFNLSLAEINFISCGMLSQFFESIGVRRIHVWFLYVQYGPACLPYFLVMIFMTIDRFMEVYLSIRYPLFWDQCYTKRLLTVLWTVTILLTFPLMHPRVGKEWFIDVCYVYFYPFFEWAFFVTSLSIYFYIFKTMQKRKRIQPGRTIVRITSPSINNLTAISRHIPTARTMGVKRRRQKKSSQHHIFVPAIIVLTFFVLIVVPDQLFMYSSVLEFKLKKPVLTYIYMSYIVGMSCDALSYILLSPVLFRHIKSVYCFWKNKSGGKNETAHLAHEALDVSKASASVICSLENGK